MMRSTTAFLVASLLLVHATAHANQGFNGVNMNGVNMNGVNMNGVNMNGVNMNGVNMNGVVLGAVSGDASLVNGLLTVNMIDAASSCAHSPGATGPALPWWCSPCAQAVENVLPACGTSTWDASCVNEAQLVCKPAGAQLVGAVFSTTLNDGSPVWLKLDKVEQAVIRVPLPTATSRTTTALRFGSDTYWYTWSWMRVPRSRFVLSRWAPVCASYDRDGVYNRAVVAPGRWADCAGYDGCGGKLSNDGFDISCRDVGAIAKCIDRMGYKPWRTGTRCGSDGTCTEVPLEPYLEACVRMVRADYCGDGTPHTVDGTAIDVMDGVGIQSRDASVDWFAEAQWSPTGAVCMSNYRTPAAAGIPLAGQCLHPPKVTEWSGPACALPMTQPAPFSSSFGGLIGDRSSAAE